MLIVIYSEQAWHKQSVTLLEKARKDVKFSYFFLLNQNFCHQNLLFLTKPNLFTLKLIKAKASQSLNLFLSDPLVSRHDYIYVIIKKLKKDIEIF